ncbi:hypothetical protein AB1L30_11995 [Bremerella sp. JC817]
MPNMLRTTQFVPIIIATAVAWETIAAKFVLANITIMDMVRTSLALNA